MKCQYCKREIVNKGSLVAHQMVCKLNPNKVTHKHSPNAGVKKGTISPLKGIKKTDKVLSRIVETVETGNLIKYCEAAARRVAKKYLIYKNGHRCSICGTSDWFGQPVPLVCDHINGDSTDNSIENFRLVCNNCDGLLPTYKSKNRGKGRKYDREYRRGSQAVYGT